MKTYKRFVLLLLILVLGALLAGCGNSSSSDVSDRKDSEESSSKSGKNGGLKDYVFAISYDGEWVGFSSSGKIVKRQMMDDIRSYSLSLDGKLFVFRTKDDELWLFDGKEFKLIANIIGDYQMAAAGKIVAYLDDDDVLYLFDGSKAVKISEGVESLKCISPDGKAVAYTVREAGQEQVFLYDGKIRELGKNTDPFALSDGGKYVYFYRETSDGTAAYVQKGTDQDSRVRLCPERIQKMIFNTGGTQILYYDGNKTYFSENGGERQAVCSEMIRPLVPAYKYLYTGYVFSSLKNQYYTAQDDSETKVLRLNGKLETEGIVKSASSGRLLPDGKTLIYVKNGDLYSMDLNEEPEGVRIAEDVRDWYLSLDGKSILFINEDKETCFVKPGNKPVRILDDPAESVCPCGKGFLYVYEGDVYFTGGEKSARINGLNDDVNYIADSPFYALIFCYDGTVYMTADGEKVTLVYEE